MEDFRTKLAEHKGLLDRKIFSEDLLQKVRSAVARHSMCSRQELCVYAAGSLGRLETGQISDLDVFLFADRSHRNAGERSLTRLEEIMALSELIQVNTELRLPPFSGDGEFFKIHEVDDLVEGTGTASDDSENLFTTRLLLLLESKCLVNDALYSTATMQIAQMYFRDGDGRHSNYKPLFLLNDILRYWRTLCLNYERTRHDAGKPWWKKNLNLKFSRKLTVFSTVLAILADHVDGFEKLEAISNMTPMERLAYAMDKLGETSLLPQFCAFLDNYEEFLAAKSHAELEDRSPEHAELYRGKAQHFDDLLHAAFASQRLDRQLVRYLLI